MPIQYSLLNFAKCAKLNFIPSTFHKESLMIGYFRKRRLIPGDRGATIEQFLQNFRRSARGNNIIPNSPTDGTSAVIDAIAPSLSHASLSEWFFPIFKRSVKSLLLYLYYYTNGICRSTVTIETKKYLDLKCLFPSWAMDWLSRIKSAEKTALIQDGKKKVHYKFKDGLEMAEEYNIETGILVRRAWKEGSSLRKTGLWEVEVGDPEPSIQSIDVGIKEDPNSPYIIKRITKKNIEWRIRNLSYPVDTYSVIADQENRCITVKTSNKKYYKKIQVEELERVNLVPKQENIEFSHKFNTLIITYKKPPQVLNLEQKILQELKDVRCLQDGDLPCKPS